VKKYLLSLWPLSLFQVWDYTNLRLKLKLLYTTPLRELAKRE
jgi:hypothetical protein